METVLCDGNVLIWTIDDDTEMFVFEDSEQAYTMYRLLTEELKRFDEFCRRIDEFYP